MERCTPPEFLIFKMKKTKVTQDKTQTRSTIPKKFVDEFEITKKDSIEWKSEEGKLKGELVKNDTSENSSSTKEDKK